MGLLEFQQLVGLKAYDEPDWITSPKRTIPNDPVRRKAALIVPTPLSA
jgi:hypothetical protein